MKKIIIATACLLLVALANFHAVEPAGAQEQQLATLVKELQAQQAVMAENQAKIEAKLAAIAESVRTARIYSSRGGS